jgi:hypothetical protein
MPEWVLVSIGVLVASGVLGGAFWLAFRPSRSKSSRLAPPSGSSLDHYENFGGQQYDGP